MTCLALLLLPLPAVAAVKNVSTVAQLQSALASAQAGDEIVLADGTYAVNGNLSCAAEGTGTEPITVRAANRHAARIQFNALEGFKVSGRYWTFDGLTIEGVCALDDNCEHAFHVTGHAEGFVLRNSRIRDFNAQLKVNATRNGSGVYEMPHRGLVERNEFYDTHARSTSKPVTKINIDTGDDWVVRDNDVHDFSKSGGISYGAFMKSGGKRGVFERNRILCVKDYPSGGTRIGLSFGGGGTASAFCAPAFDASVPCDPEHTDGIVRNNVIINCSDVGIYLNKAANTKVLFNTLISTTGVDFRFASTTGEAHGNVLSSAVRARDSGSFDAGTNLMNVATGTWTTWYQAPLSGDLRLKGNVSQLIGAATARDKVMDDFCARPRPSGGAYTLGALEHSLVTAAREPARTREQHRMGGPPRMRGPAMARATPAPARAPLPSRAPATGMGRTPRAGAAMPARVSRLGSCSSCCRCMPAHAGAGGGCIRQRSAEGSTNGSRW